MEDDAAPNDKNDVGESFDAENDQEQWVVEDAGKLFFVVVSVNKI